MADKEMVLTPSTLVPLGMVVGIILSLVTGSIYFERKFSTMTTQMSDMQHNVNLKLQTIQERMLNRWTAQDMKIWEQELKIHNPELTVPNSSEIVRTRAIAR